MDTTCQRILPRVVQSINRTCRQNTTRHLSVSAALFAEHDPELGTLSKKKKFKQRPEDHFLMKYNDIVYPPQEPGEPRRPAEICHIMMHIRYSPKKLWYMTTVVQGKSIEEALKNLSFLPVKGAAIAKQVLEEAQEIAVRDYNVEYRSNLWVETAKTLKGDSDYYIRKAAKRGYQKQETRYSHFFVRLREGKPPEHYYPPNPNGQQQLEEYIRGQRKRTIRHSL